MTRIGIARTRFARSWACVLRASTVNRAVLDAEGNATPYDNLILATGSSPFIPPIPGVNRDNVHVFRTLDDTRELIGKARPGCKAVVIGGGLLGLEAARGLQLRGCEVSVVHLVETLMERQLDASAGACLQRKIEELGIRVLLPRQTKAILGNGHAAGLAFSTGEEIDADLVVIAAGIKPNSQLARDAGLDVGRGIMVNDYLQTSDPAIYAVGECTEHRGQTFGLVAPLIEQGKVLAAAITGNESSAFSGAAPAAKLKIMGLDIFSAGSIDESEPGVEAVRYEDASLGIYKKLLVKDNVLRGVILVGDASGERRYTQWLTERTGLAPHRRHLLFPPPAADTGLEVAEMPDSEVICGCNGVTKGQIIHAIHEKGVNTLGQLKQCTRASSSCGSCTGLVPADFCGAVSPRNSWRRPGQRCARACRSRMSVCARSCAASG